ncbi:MAG TPA: FtsX-like permease family protein [Gaiellaceae bacterium]|nr:FtsX-like permease family protein [Gaiellaceae bacterium]
MRRVALRGIFGRKLRTALTAFSVVLGVAMVTGSFVLTDTMSKAFDSIFSSSYEQTDVVVSGRSLVEWSDQGNALVTDDLLRRVRALPDVDAAAGEITDLNSNANQAHLIDRDGEIVTGNGNPTFGLGIDPSQPRFNPLKLVAGEFADAPGEVVVDASSARKLGFEVGDDVRVAVGGPVRSFKLVGIAQYGDVDTIGSATMAIFDVRAAQRLLEKPGYDVITVAGRDGVSDEVLIRQVETLLPANAQVRTAAEQAEADKKGVSEFIDFIRYALLGFGVIALFVGAFVIFNTLSITVAQRTRELATLRTLGATRAQVLGSVVLEALAVGLAASLAGIAAGIGLAKGLTALFASVGLDLPRSELVFATRTWVVALALGMIVTLAASIAPALRATRVSAISAVREGATVPRGRLARYSFPISVGLVSIAAATLAYGLFVPGVAPFGRVLSLALGTLALFVGVALVSTRVVTPLARVLGWPGARFGGAAGRLARGNAVRMPGRTAATAAALMVGLALVTFVTVMGQGLRASERDAVVRQIDADYVVVSQNGWTTLPAIVGETAARSPGVEVSSSVRRDRGRVLGRDVDISGIDPASLGEVFHLEWESGSPSALRSLRPRDAIVRKSFADENGFALGGAFIVRTPTGEMMNLRVRAVYDPPRFDSLLGNVVVRQSTFDRFFERPGDSLTLVWSNAPSSSLASSLAAYPDARVVSDDTFVDERVAEIDGILNLLYALLALSVIVSLFGMVNTLVLVVFERTREIGMLRAVGLTRRQTRRMIRHESVVTALIGAAIGLPLGIALATAATAALADYDLSLSIPAVPLAVFALVAIGAGIAAAVLPARRASRLNVLEALQYE